MFGFRISDFVIKVMSFNDIIGQEIAIRLLKGGMKKARIPNAYLFYGPDGVGKKLTATILAKTLNCEQERFDSCDKCENCIMIERGISPDVEVIKPGEKGSILIDTIRELKQRTSYKSAYGKYKVTIITEAEKMTEESSNAFLKILEEPPDNHLFILITQNRDFLFSTIISRTQKVLFRRLHTHEISFFLGSNTDIEQEKSELVSTLSNGSIGNALNILENQDNLRKRMPLFLRSSTKERINFLEEVITSNPELEEFIQMLETIYRDALFFSIGLFDRIRNSDLSLDGIKDSGKGIRVCEDVYQAIRKNVKKELSIPFLANELS